MISSVLSHDEQDELLSAARANVGLIADTIWAPLDRDDPYRRLNRTLWTRCCKIATNEGKPGAGGRKRVRDVIPESRLASYGDFEYADVESAAGEEQPEDQRHAVAEEAAEGGGRGGDATAALDAREKAPATQSNGRTGSPGLREPWMLDEVEEYVDRVVADAHRRRRQPRKSLLKFDGSLKDSQHTNSASLPPEDTTPAEQDPPRFTVTNVSEAQLEGRIFSEAVRKLWRGAEFAPPPRRQQQQQQPRGCLRRCPSELQRELGLLKPQAQTSHPQQQQQQAASKRPDLQQTHCSFQNERLRMPSRCQYSYVQAINMVHRPLAPLCVDVPEFFPKGPGSWPVEEHPKPLQFYPSTSDNPYQDELFPYKGHVTGRKTVTVYQNTLVPLAPTPIVSAVVWPSQIWPQQRLLSAPIQIHQIPSKQATPAPIMSMQHVPPAPRPSCPNIVHRPIRIPEVVNKPVHPQQLPQSQQSQQLHPHNQQQQQQQTQHHKGAAPIPVYQRPNKAVPEYSQRRKSQGVDFNNLILLTKSAMKVRRNQGKATRKSFAESTKSQQTVTKAEVSAARWFEKGCQSVMEKQDRDSSSAASRMPSESGSLEPSLDTASSRERSGRTSQSAEEDYAEAEGTSQRPASRKRLYSDVLESLAPTPDSVVFERRYDELERQAMEQYRNSEECLALRYQELEQQALEQYRNAESSESLNVESENYSPNTRNDNDVAGSTNDDANQESRDCLSGFGKFNLSKKALAIEEKGNEVQRRIKILKPESKATAPVVHRALSEGSLRPIAVARRLAGISGAAGHVRESKNTIRGASGEKIVKTSSLSSLKRRLMPMSPLERNKSGAILMKSASLDPMKAVQNLDKHVAAYYRNTKVIQTGGGDDKANNAGVWLSDFWS